MLLVIIYCNKRRELQFPIHNHISTNFIKYETNKIFAKITFKNINNMKNQIIALAIGRLILFLNKFFPQCIIVLLFSIHFKFHRKNGSRIKENQYSIIHEIKK